MKNIDIPKRIARLPRAENGYPIPFFVPIIKGKPDFRVADEGKRLLCLKNCVCWICGQPLEKIVAFAGGSLSLKNRMFSDGPMHLDCAEFAMKVCPHILNKAMQRKDIKDIVTAVESDIACQDKVEYYGLHISRRGCWAIHREASYWCWRPEPAREIRWWDSGVCVPDPWAAQGGWQAHAEKLIEEKVGEKKRQSILKAYVK